jgi:hypothetical protein
MCVGIWRSMGGAERGRQVNRSMKLVAPIALAAAVAAAGRMQSPPVAPPPAEARPLPPLAMFAGTRFEPGAYQLSMIDPPQAQPRTACIAHPDQLVRLRHAAIEGCTHLVVENAADRATVHYDCPAQGWGRTTIQNMKADGLRIETQGIADRQPFEQTLNARRVGACPDRRSQ